MISVEAIVNSMYGFLRKDQSGGYFTDEEINSYFQSSQTTLFQYFMEEKQKGSKNAQDALQPFLKSTTITYTNGTSPFPSDYLRSDTMMYKWSVNDCDGIKVQDIPVPFITQSEYSNIVKDGNRKPNILKQRIYYSFVNNLLNIYPRTVTESEFIYFRPPADAIYATTITNTPLGALQQFDAANSVDFEWNASQQENIVDLCLFYAAGSIRDTPVIQFAQQKQHEELIR